MQRTAHAIDTAFASPRAVLGPRRLRVAVVSETYPPEINGVALTVATLTRGLHTERHDVLLIRPSQPSFAAEDQLTEELIVPGGSLPRYPALRFGWPVYFRVRAALKRFRTDALYIATEGPLGWAAMLAARHLGIPVASGFHTRFDDFVGHYGLGFLRSSAFRYLRAFHNRGQATLVPTEQLRAELCAGGFRDVRILERGVDSDLFHPSRRSGELRKLWGVADNELAVLFVGRVAPEKNLDLTVRAFDAIAAKTPAKMIWVGDGPARAATAEHYPQHVWCGMQRGEKLAEHFASCDLFLFASITETFGNVTLEAMASGLPTVAYAYGAAGQHICDGIDGRTVAFNDEQAFVAVASDLASRADERRAMGVAARNTAQKLGPRAVSERFAAILSELAGASA